MTQSCGQSLKRKPKVLNDTNVLDRIQAHPGATIDLVAINVLLYLSLKNCTQMTVNKCVMCLSAIRDRYRILLQEKGLKGGEMYRTTQLKKNDYRHTSRIV